MAETTLDRETALRELNRALDEYVRAYETVPNEALAFVPSGEDYTLGGLVPHVYDVIYHYGDVLDLIRQANYAEIRVIEDEQDKDKQARMDLIRQGYGGPRRKTIFDELRAAHEAFAKRIEGVSASEFGRKAPVLYGGDATEPYPTAAADIAGWVIDHYREHTDQVAELLEKWRASSR